MVSTMKPTGVARLNSSSRISRPPGGMVGCTNTGRPWRSISAQTGANSGSDRSRPRMLASVATPRAPSARARASSASAASGDSQGSDAIQQIRPGYFAWLSANAALAIRAAFALTSGVPQNTFGPVSDSTAVSTPAASIAANRRS